MYALVYRLPYWSLLSPIPPHGRVIHRDPNCNNNNNLLWLLPGCSVFRLGLNPRCGQQSTAHHNTAIRDHQQDSNQRRPKKIHRQPTTNNPDPTPSFHDNSRSDGAETSNQG